MLDGNLSQQLSLINRTHPCRRRVKDRLLHHQNCPERRTIHSSHSIQWRIQHVRHLEICLFASKLTNTCTPSPHVRPGSYLLEVQSIDHVYPKIRVDINEENQVQAAYTGLGIDWNQRGYSVVYPLEIQAKAEAEYFMVGKSPPFKSAVSLIQP